MKSRQEIKAIAKEAAANQRSVAIVLLLIWWGIYAASMLISAIPFIGGLISLAASFILMALVVDIDCGAFVKIYRGETTTVSEPFNNVKVNFWRKVGGMWWMVLFIYLWMLLLVVPGIIKSYSYFMTPYILANHPNVKATEALKLSKRMMHGYKLELFVASLSFIGWILLSSLTLGILYFVYVGPYMYSTFAGYFIQIRDKALADGVVSQSELDGVSAA